MSTDPETRLREAFDARAATTTTSSDAWARINRRVDRHDHRRSVVLRGAAAAAVIVLLVVGGGIAIFRDESENASTVATSKAADAAAGAARSEAAPAAPFVPNAGGLEVQQNADGSIVARLGETTTPPVQPGGISAAIEGGTVFGVVPSTAGSVMVSAPIGAGATADWIADLVLAPGPYRTFRIGGMPSAAAAVTVEAGGLTTVAQREENR